VKKYLLLLVLLLPVTIFAQDLFMVRSEMSFPEAMTVLQEAIGKRPYQLSRVQRVDIGLTKSGYATDKYRVVFFGDIDELNLLSEQYPELVPYFPMKIAIFAEGDETILLAASFAHLRPHYTSSSLQARFDKWESDILEILEEVRTAQ
jgi:uncharacterized protein (DUF302 family)